VDLYGHAFEQTASRYERLQYYQARVQAMQGKQKADGLNSDELAALDRARERVNFLLKPEKAKKAA
jgi:hypothetical protein